MSLKLITAVFDRYPFRTELSLALALADFARDDGTHIFPGLATLAEKAKLSERATQYQLRKMLDQGFLEIEKNGRGGRGVFVQYRISMAWIKGAELAPFILPKKQAKSVDNSDKKGCNFTQERVQKDVQKGAIFGSPYITTRTTIEPSPLPPEGGEPGFDEVAAGYPRQVDMQKARARWDKIAPDAKLQGEIAQAIKVWTRSPEWQRDDGRWIPKFSNWLRGERWRDIPGVLAAPPPPVEFVQASAPAVPMPAHVRERVNAILGRAVKPESAIEREDHVR